MRSTIPLPASFSLVCGLSSSQVFPTIADRDDNLPDLRDMEGPSMRELMEIERVARMSRGAVGAANV